MPGDSRKDTIGQSEDCSLASSSLTTRNTSSRPPINYSSFGAFWKSVGERWRSIWTKQFILALLAGQLLSLCITCTNVTTTELVNRGWTLSTTQGFFLWVLTISNLTKAEKCWCWLTSYLLDISLSSLYTHPIQYINVSSSFVVFQSSMCFPCIRWIQGVGEGHSLRWLEMYVNLVGTMKPMLTITQRGFRYHFRCLWCGG